MPIYDYTCSACGRVTEVIHGIHESAPRFCPACGAEGTLRKGFAAPAVHFKGSGWAKKDRKATSSPGKRPESPESKTGSGAAEAGSSTSADTAPAPAATADAAPAKASDD